MNQFTGRGSNEAGAELVRSVLAIVLAGAALGIAYNALLQRGNPTRALPWIHGESALASLESQQSAAPGGDEAGAPPASAPGAGLSAAGSEPVVERARASSGSAAEQPPALPAGGRETPHAQTPPSPPAPATPGAPGSRSSAPAPGLPVIPDTREPLDVQLATVKKLYDAGAAVVVDARSTEEYAVGHIAGAVSLSFDEVWKDEVRLRQFDPGGRPVIIYCGGGDCEVSKNLAYALIDAGKKKVLVFTGGLPEWQQAGYPVARGNPGGSR